MIEKILKKIEEIRMIYFLTIANGGNEKLDCAYVYVEKAIDKCKEIVQEAAKEYGTVNDNDLAVVSALPSLYPLQKFEEEAIHKVVASAKDGGWIPCSERLPEEPLNSVLGWDEYRERCVFVRYAQGEWILGNYESVKIIAWQPLPDPYQKGE